MNLHKDKHGIFLGFSKSDNQALELEMRQEIAEKNYSNYFDEISQHHSLEVMYKEVNKFLMKIPRNGRIIDAGGCWGWHWKFISKIRPDVTIYITDFVHSNLIHAKNILDEKTLSNNIRLINADICDLPFEDDYFDGYWTVQTLQHIEHFEAAIKEAHRVLKRNGYFSNYSLNNQWLMKLLFKLLRRPYHVKGIVQDTFYLERLSQTQINIAEETFKAKASIKYSEILFKPEIKLSAPGKFGLIGKLDSYLSNPVLFSGIARQHSIHLTKV